MIICRNDTNFRQIILYTSLNLYDLCLKNVSSVLKKVKNMYVVSNLEILFFCQITTFIKVCADFICFLRFNIKVILVYCNIVSSKFFAYKCNFIHMSHNFHIHSYFHTEYFLYVLFKNQKNVLTLCI